MERVFVFVNTVDLDDVSVSAYDVEDFGFFFDAFEIGGVVEKAFVD